MGEENSVLLIYMWDVRCGHGFRGYMLRLVIDDINNLDRMVVVTGDWSN